MDVGSIAICVALGALICFVYTGIGVCIGRGGKDDIKREYELDSDITIYVPVRYRRGSRDQRDSKPTPEEIETVLYLLRIGASNHEKEIIDYLIDKEGIHEENVYPGGNDKETDRTGQDSETIRFSRKVARQDRY